MRKGFAFLSLSTLVVANWTTVTGRIRKDAQHAEEYFELMRLPLYIFYSQYTAVCTATAAGITSPVIPMQVFSSWGLGYL